MRLDSEEDAAALVAWFSGDRARRHVRLIVDGQPAGGLDRSTLLAALPTRVLGEGDSGRLELPGEPSVRQWQWFELVCPNPSCPESPVVAASFVVADPPHCRVHPSLTLRLRE